MVAAVSASATGDTAFDDVVRRAQGGDVDAFEAIYRAHAASIYGLCRRMTRDEAEARENVQDVFVRAWERLASFRGESTFGTWLHRLAVNVVLGRLRSVKRDDARLIEGNDATYPERTPHDSLETRLDVSAALATLPAGARSVFVLHDIYGYSHDEIAEMTGIAAATSRVQLWRARRALTRMLDD